MKNNSEGSEAIVWRWRPVVMGLKKSLTCQVVLEEGGRPHGARPKYRAPTRDLVVSHLSPRF